GRASTGWHGASDLCRRCCAARLERTNGGWSAYPRRSSSFWGLGGSPVPIGGGVRVGAARRGKRHEIPSLLDVNSGARCRPAWLFEGGKRKAQAFGETKLYRESGPSVLPGQNKP